MDILATAEPTLAMSNCLRLVQGAGEEHVLVQDGGVRTADVQLHWAVNPACQGHTSAGGVNASS